MEANKIKVLCTNNCSFLSSGTPLLVKGNEYIVDGSRTNPTTGVEDAFTIEGINEVCDCCGERVCFPKQAFLPLN